MQPQAEYEPTAIRALFDEMAATYGVVNLISSFGFSARWRHEVVRNLPLPDSARVVDLMSGMCELSRSLSRYAPPTIRLTAVDISPEMTRRARRDWPFVVECLLEDVLTWTFKRGSADAVISSFGLKTFNAHQQAQLAGRVATLLRPGGIFSFVEISVPPGRVLRRLYMFYLNRLIPWIGRLFLGNPENYRMLGFYTGAFENCRHFAQCLRNEGLDVQPTSYFFGCATGVRGVKR